jgi:hypothetical protein
MLRAPFLAQPHRARLPVIVRRTVATNMGQLPHVEQGHAMKTGLPVDPAISGRQFSWSGKVRIVSDPPTYILSAADWMTLVEKFGLAANVNDVARKG